MTNPRTSKTAPRAPHRTPHPYRGWWCGVGVPHFPHRAAPHLQRCGITGRERPYPPFEDRGQTPRGGRRAMYIGGGGLRSAQASASQPPTSPRADYAAPSCKTQKSKGKPNYDEITRHRPRRSPAETRRDGRGRRSRLRRRAPSIRALSFRRLPAIPGRRRRRAWRPAGRCWRATPRRRILRRRTPSPRPPCGS